MRKIIVSIFLAFKLYPYNLFASSFNGLWNQSVFNSIYTKYDFMKFESKYIFRKNLINFVVYFYS